MPTADSLIIRQATLNPEDPFANDELDRSTLAKRLSKYVDRLADGAVLGIDAPWGEGKSWFGRRWAVQLAVDHKVGYIDAFESDYVDDPFVLIVAELSKLVECGQTSPMRRKAGEVAKALAPATLKAVVNFAGRTALGVVDLTEKVEEAIDKATETAASAAEKWFDKRIQAVESERSSIAGFKSELQKIAENQSKPIVVFIDELDRCRPSFAVTLIERVKHLFSVPNLVFVLLLNRDQLAQAVAGVYGSGIDGHAYLGKFVNIWFDLPRLHARGDSSNWGGSYVAGVLRQYSLPKERERETAAFAGELQFWTKHMRLSLRDVERACALHAIADAKSLPFLTYLIALKIKHADRFARLRHRDVATNRECAKWLREQAGNEPANAWPGSYLHSLAQLHEVEAGLLNVDQADILKQHYRDTLGNLSPDRALPWAFDLIDLPLGK